MRKLVSAIVMLGMLSAGPALAAEDMRFAAQGHGRASGTATGFGAALRINLGHSSHKESPRALLSIGPSVGAGGRHSVADLGRLGVMQSGAIDVRIAGRPLLDRPERLGATDSASEGKGPSTVGWVAIALGTVALVGGIAVLAVASSVQDE